MTVVECALAEIGERKTRGQALEKERALLRAKLKHIQQHAISFDPMLGQPHTRPSNPRLLQERLEQIETSLTAAGASTGSLDESLKLIA